LNTPEQAPGISKIIKEANRTYTRLPLYVAVGGGLTEVASAILLAPEIASKMTLIRIGGGQYPDRGRANITSKSTRWPLNKYSIGQMSPSGRSQKKVYATCQISFAELETRVEPRGRLGHWLYQKTVASAQSFASRFKINTGEKWTLGDGPLVLLSALTSWPPSGAGAAWRYEETGASAFDQIVTAALATDGAYQLREDGRKMRIYRNVDTRLMFEDMFAKLKLNAA
jgi:hypothetical protein